MSFQAVDKAASQRPVFFLPASHSRGIIAASIRSRGGPSTPRTTTSPYLRLVATPQDTGLIPFKQPPWLPIGLAPRDRLNLAPIAVTRPILRMATQMSFFTHTGIPAGCVRLLTISLQPALLGHSQQRQTVFAKGSEARLAVCSFI